MSQHRMTTMHITNCRSLLMKYLRIQRFCYNLSYQNSNLQMEIDTVSKSLIYSSVKSSSVLSSVSPSSAALSSYHRWIGIWHRERRKNNTIVNNFPEASDHQSDKDSFANFCSSTLKRIIINKMLFLEKKVHKIHS